VTDKLLNAGESYQIPFTLDQSINAWGTHLNFEYDPEIMEIVGVYSDHFNSSMIWNENEPGQISAIAVSQTGVAHSVDNTSTGDNILVYVEFKALQNAVIGDNLKLSDTRLSYALLEDFSKLKFAGSLEGEITVNTFELESGLSVSVYPNPVSDYLNVEFSETFDNRDYNIEILDFRGRTVTSLYNENRVDVSSLSAGMYIYKIIVGDKIIADRFMVTR